MINNFFSIPVTNIQLSNHQELFVLAALIRKNTVFIKSNTQLCLSPEAFASAFLIPSMKLKTNILIDDNICPTWMANSLHVQKTVQDWGRYSGGNIVAKTRIKPRVSSKKAAFFTAGVDSFYTLIKEESSLNYIIYVSGFDISLNDTLRLKKVKKHIEKVANEFNTLPIFVTTNLRANNYYKVIS